MINPDRAGLPVLHKDDKRIPAGESVRARQPLGAVSPAQGDSDLLAPQPGLLGNLSGGVRLIVTPAYRAFPTTNAARPPTCRTRWTSRNEWYRSRKYPSRSVGMATRARASVSAGDGSDRGSQRSRLGVPGRVWVDIAATLRTPGVVSRGACRFDESDLSASGVLTGSGAPGGPARRPDNRRAAGAASASGGRSDGGY